MEKLYKFINLFWQLVKANYEIEDTETYWQKLLDESNKMCYLYPEDRILSKFIKKVMIAFYEYQEDRAHDN